MQLKSLIILALIAIMSVGMAFFVMSKGFLPFGKTDNESEVTQTGSEDNGDEALIDSEDETEEDMELISSSVVEASDKLPDFAIIPFDPIVVNLKGSFGRRYLKVTVNLGILKDDEAEGGEEEEEDKKKKKKEKDDEEEDGKENLSIKEIVEKKTIEIKDILISLFSAKSIDDVGGWANQDLIREEIKEVLNNKLQLDNGIKKVFFTEFVIQ